MSFGVVHLKLRPSKIILMFKIDFGSLIWHDRTQKRNTGSMNFEILQS